MKKKGRGNRDLERKKKNNNYFKIFYSETKQKKPNPLKNRYRDIDLSYIYNPNRNQIRGVEMMR